MSKRVTLSVTMELCSDAIFGSGYSIPGGEDIAVRVDEAGYPYLSGTTLKGLLRESLENLLVWTGGQESLLVELLGKEDWEGEAAGRRLRFTQMTMTDKPEDPQDCFDSRIFTAIENGIVGEGTLRQAACICKNLTFSGRVLCAEEDTNLVTDALRGIKWAGTMRNRGFGRVKVSVSQTEAGSPALRSVGEVPCIRYRLHNRLPVQTTDLNRSYGNFYETKGWISGGAVRGAVMTALAQNEPEWFRTHKSALLNGVRFLDAVPVHEEGAVLPSIRGFYEDKACTRFETVVVDGTFTEGSKRAKLGTFCSIEGDTIHYWSARTNGVTRIDRGEKQMLQTRYLEAGQDFEGCILLDDPSLAPAIAEAIPETLWLGADRWAGFGECAVTLLEGADRPCWAEYGFDETHRPGTTLYLLALTPFTMLDELGEPCGLDLEALADMLGVTSLTGERNAPLCATAMAEYGGYNSTWQCRRPDLSMYDRGSIFKLECDTAPELEKLMAIQNRGLGVRTAEGFGQILFLRPDIFEGIRRKEGWEAQKNVTQSPTAQLRIARYNWVTEHISAVRNSGLSSSQLGSIQALCEQAMAAGGDRSQLKVFMDKNLNDRGKRHAARFEKIDALLDKVLDQPLGETLGIACEDSMTARLELLILLFNHSRKEKEKEGER